MSLAHSIAGSQRMIAFNELLSRTPEILAIFDILITISLLKQFMLTSKEMSCADH